MKFAAVLFAVLFSSVATAGTVYQDRDHAPQLIDVVQFPRMKIWSNYQHVQSAEGHILVCNVPQENRWETVCYAPDSKKTRTAWTILQDVVVPGFVLKAYDLRSNGTLIAYYGPATVTPAKK